MRTCVSQTTTSLRIPKEKKDDIPQRLAIPMADNTYRRQPIPNLQRKLIKVQVWIKKIALVLPALFKLELLPVGLVEEVLLPLGSYGGYAERFANRDAVAFGALFVDDDVFVALDFVL
jgi:hypothetical protein